MQNNSKLGWFSRVQAPSFADLSNLGFRISSIFVLLGALPVDATAGFAPVRVRDDVAIHAGTGDTFIVQTQQNPSGEVILLRDSDANFRETVQLLPGADTETHFEIEMTPSGVPAYLIQQGDAWLVGRLLKSGAGRLEPTHPMLALRGEGLARNLTALPDGNLALTVQSPRGGQAEVVLLSEKASAGGEKAEGLSHYAVVERVAESRVAERTSTLISSESSGPEPKLESSSGLGFAAGALAGLGVAYRRHFANKWGIQVAGIAFGGADHLMGSLGVNLLRTLSRSQRVRFYALFGVAAFYTGTETSESAPWGSPECNESNPKCPIILTGWQNSVLLNFGAGIGMEIELAKNLGLALELPLTVMLNLGDDQPLLNGVYPIPSASLIYYF